jgi:UPF0755 protein
VSTRLRLSIIGFGSALLLLAVVAGVAYQALHRPLCVTPDTQIVVADGESFSAVARRLAAQGVIADPQPITWYARATGAARRVRSGEFSLASATTPLDVLDILLSGTPVQHEARLLEGWTLGQTLDYLAGLDTLRHALADTSEAQLMATLGLEPQMAEGWFFPDTYRFERGTQDVAVLLTAHRKMQQELDRVWQERDADLPYSHPYQVLIMASLIEKETGLDAERAKIARVFTSRLEQGMRLQTDPTVIYGLGEDFDGNLTRAHLNQDGPYNTYRRAGLPPTPIALPGKRSLEAAVHPAPGTYLYFVARGDGSSQFSATLDEHLAAVRRYQLNR